MGKLVNKYVYEQLPPGVHEELRRRNPRTENGRRVHNHHQLLTADTGKSEFMDLFERAFPPAQGRLPFVVEVPPAE